jgi:hypothetical protein
LFISSIVEESDSTRTLRSIIARRASSSEKSASVGPAKIEREIKMAALDIEAATDR